MGNEGSGRSDAASRVLLAAILGVATFWGIHQLRPPPALPADAPATEFSSGRAMEHLGRIAARPHPLGSVEHRKVRDYIVAALVELGLQPHVHEARIVRARSARSVRAARVRNIIGRIRGTGKGEAVLLVSHYDSEINAPGATDDGSGVVAMLETLRALQHHPPLENDLVYLFSDGEEFGLLGARAFAEQHPWIDDVGLVLNFEGSGSAGQSLMFETGPGNAGLIAEFAKAVPFPIATSASYEVYRRMPNDTDFSVFKERGLPGLNFSCIDNRYDYHTMGDSVGNIDERFLRHQGSHALALALHFGNADLDLPRSGNAVYFNTIGFGFAHYPEAWVLPLNGVALLGFIGILVLGFRAGKLRLLHLCGGLIAFLLHVALPATVVTCLIRALERSFRGPDWWLLYYNHRLLLAGFSCLTLALVALLHVGSARRWRPWAAVALWAGLIVLLRWGDLLGWMTALGSVVAWILVYLLARRPIRPWSLAVGALCGWTALTVVVGFALPGASYLFTWPLLLALIPPGWVFCRGEPQTLSVPRALLLAFAAVPTILWFSGLVYLFFVAMGLSLAGAAVVLVGLPLGLLLPQIHALTSTRAWILPGGAGLAGLLLILVGSAGADFDERFRKPSSLTYAFNADSDASFWYGFDPQPDAWSATYLGRSPDEGDLSDVIPGSQITLRRAAAPDAGLDPPEVVLVEDTEREGARSLKLRVVSARGAPIVNLFFPPRAGIVSARIDGELVAGLGETGPDHDEQWWRWRYYALPAEGVELELRIDAADPFEIRATDFSYGLPGLPELRPRPAVMMPGTSGLSDMTLVTKGFVF